MEALNSETSWLGAESPKPDLGSNPAFTIWKPFDLEKVTLSFGVSVASSVKGQSRKLSFKPRPPPTGSFKTVEGDPSDVFTGPCDFAKMAVSYFS